MNINWYDHKPHCPDCDVVAEYKGSYDDFIIFCPGCDEVLFAHSGPRLEQP